eukprot:RCo016180
MALQCFAEGESWPFASVEPPARVLRAPAMEAFISNFGARHKLTLKGIEQTGDFCPARTTAVIICCLRLVTQSLPLVLLRLRGLVAKTRRIQAWLRGVLRARDENIQQIFEHWVASDDSQKKSLRAELYRNSWLRPSAVRTRLGTYTKLHNKVEAMHAAVVELYWERRKEFRRENHLWYSEFSVVQREREHLEGLLRQARRRKALVVSEGGDSTGMLVGTLEVRLDGMAEDVRKLLLSRPTFDFSVKTVSRSELLRALNRPKQLTLPPKSPPDSDGKASAESALSQEVTSPGPLSPLSPGPSLSHPPLIRHGTWGGVSFQARRGGEARKDPESPEVLQGTSPLRSFPCSPISDHGKPSTILYDPFSFMAKQRSGQDSRPLSPPLEPQAVLRPGSRGGPALPPLSPSLLPMEHCAWDSPSFSPALSPTAAPGGPHYSPGHSPVRPRKLCSLRTQSSTNLKGKPW